MRTNTRADGCLKINLLVVHQYIGNYRSWIFDKVNHDIKINEISPWSAILKLFTDINTANVFMEKVYRVSDDNNMCI